MKGCYFFCLHVIYCCTLVFFVHVVFINEQNELAMATQAADCFRNDCTLLPPVVQTVTPHAYQNRESAVNSLLSKQVKKNTHSVRKKL